VLTSQTSVGSFSFIHLCCRLILDALTLRGAREKHQVLPFPGLPLNREELQTA
ncbi:hypothetical protein NDU88_000271, partial [Pleurodeles waltl]